VVSSTIFSINGKIVEESRAVIPVTDRGFLYGDGLFETMHAYGRKIFRMSEHLQRLSRGAGILSFNPKPDIRRFGAWIQSVVDSADFREANVRLTITRGSGPRGPSIKGPFKPCAVIMVTEFHRPSEKLMKKGTVAVIARIRRQEASATATLKTLNYIDQVLARREADAVGADEALLLNNAGLLCEGSASNISLVRNGSVVIPDPQLAGALPGIAQLTALEAARRLKIPVLQTALSPWDPARSEEAFLTGSMREISPLVRVDDKPIGSGKPGPLTQRLIKEYRRIVEKECKPFRY
jgi:branched-chain amino acid aminotransferase